jgi:hypothetical protein
VAERERVEAREELLVRQVAGGAEDDEGTGLGVRAIRALEERVLQFLLRRSVMPASRGGRRRRGAWRTGAGCELGLAARVEALVQSGATAPAPGPTRRSRRAASTAPRPSRRPVRRSPRDRDCRRALRAVRSSSQEEMTLPRRHSSVTAARSRS